ncbi:MAG: SH3 domain-containing protein [Clostridia bacterium]|nr:SH3 domain-containing protein [Clostridia bacterium]
MKRRNYRRNRISFSSILTSIAVVAFAFIFISLATPEVQAAEHMDNSVGTIRYEYVNMRSKPSTGSKIVDVLYQGSSVTFTGNYMEYFLDDVYPFWVEVEVDGETGWIVMESVSGFSTR